MEANELWVIEVCKVFLVADKKRTRKPPRSRARRGAGSHSFSSSPSLSCHLPACIHLDSFALSSFPAMPINFITFTIVILLPSSVYSLREQCCKDLGVPEKCYQPLCNPSKIPKVMLRYKIFDPDINCHPYLLPISQCLSKGRDVSSCCYKNAYDLEFDYCFGLCNGTMHFDYSRKKDFLSCFVLHVVSIFPCLTSSYESSPSEARELTIDEKTENSVSIKWKEPTESPDLVDHYTIHLIERTGVSETESVFTTEDIEYTLEGLSSSFSYSVHVVAHAPVHNDDRNWFKSRISNVILFTTEDALIVAKSEDRLPSNVASHYLYCKMRTIFNAESSIEWVKISANGEEIITTDKKYSIVSYQSELDSKTIVSSLKIFDFKDSDFSTYRCYIKDTRIEYSETVIVKIDFSEQAPNSIPPDTLLECCSKYNHKSDCQSVCSQGTDDRRSMLRPGLQFFINL